MKYTSAEANKLLKSLETRRNSVLLKERKSSHFVISVGEKAEEVRPEYDFRKTQAELDELNKAIRTVKHAINVFNTTHTIPGHEDMTIDQLLVYLPQLSEKVRKLKEMADTLPRERMESYRKEIVEYSIANYDHEEAEAEYFKASKELTDLQLALDIANTSEVMEINVAFV